ncbi:MAG TPA: hypothetical protein VMT64_13350 [Candidatus Binataceae bacterium]|nr:hypothetical protein [Candidatus Binataceae bacterium]
MPEADAKKESVAQVKPENDRTEPPAAYIPACGTLCDAFWWARPSKPALACHPEGVSNAND